MPEAGAGALGGAATGPAWVADPSIAWRILLTADLTHALDPGTARTRLAGLHAAQHWPGPARVVVGDDVAELCRDLGEERSGVVSLGLAGGGRQVVVSAHHAAVDGLGLLAVLAAVTGSPVTSSARGVGDRPDSAGAVGTVVRRLGEVVARPPARIAVPPGPGAGTQAEARAGRSHDVHVARDVPGEVRTVDLVLAASRGVLAHNERLAHGRPRARHRRHVAVAVGVARQVTASSIADRSALLRLRDAERLDRDAVAAALREAPTQRPPAEAASGTVGAGLVRMGMRVLAPRLGSTLLVSHLGRVRGEGLESLAFHPVTVGGSGVSLGACTFDTSTGTTTRVTLRARGDRWTHDGLEQLLEAVVDALG